MKTIKTVNYIKSITQASEHIEASRGGRFKYKCDDCGEITFLSSRERQSHNMPKCQYCGSSWLEPVTGYAQDSVADARANYTDRKNIMKQKMNV